jgi:hypothetical protein
VRHYATLFDMTYAAKGLVLWQSLAAHHRTPWTLWVLPMDERTHEALLRLRAGLENVRIIPPSAVIRGPLAERRAERTVAEFCWTATPFVIEAVFQSEEAAEHVTYLDADLCFYADPEEAWREIGHRDVAVVPHRFLAEDYQRLRPNGLFNVSWVSFGNGRPARSVLARWREQCLARCSAATSGDQRYLDEWPSLLSSPGSLCIFENHAVGVAPWNVRRYRVTDGPCVDGAPIVFYHFHELTRLAPRRYSYTGYPLRPEDEEHIYRPYVDRLERMHDVLDERLAPGPEEPRAPR